MTGSMFIPVPEYGVGDSSDFPTGRNNHSSLKGFQISSDFSGDEAGSDSTGRINLYSFQRAAAYSLGENIRRFLMRKDAKSMDAWYGPKAGWNGDRSPDESQGWTPIAWAGAHFESNAHNGMHNHWSVEIPDVNGDLQTRLSIPFAPTDPADPRFGQLGLAKTNIGVIDADLTAYASTGAKFRVGGAAANRVLEFSNDPEGADAGRRWQVLTNATAESGSPAGTGSDFEIRRMDDAGATPQTAFMIERRTGRISVGSNAIGAEGMMTAVWGGGAQGFSAKPSAAIGNSAAFDANLAAASPATDRALQIRIQAASASRFVVWGDGKIEWGTDAGRDTNIYRDNANVLATDDAFQFTELADPSAPAANKARLYARDNGSGKTQLCVRFPTGAIQVLSTEP